MLRATATATAVAIAAALLADVAAAEDRDPVIVELYTSQGCSACPPADAYIATLTERDDVLPLALHVDYWDYLGWADGFAKAGFTKRQKAYARGAGKAMIYTPQIIVGGTDRVVGARTGQIDEALAAHLDADAAPTPVEVVVERVPAGVMLSAGAAPDLGGVVVQVVSFRPHERVEIPRGENAGHTIDYVNIVTDWRIVGAWDGSEPLDMTVPQEGPGAVILQRPGPGAVVAAARID